MEAGTLPGLRGTWTVHHESLGGDNQRLHLSAAAAAAQAAAPFHSYLIIALEAGAYTRPLFGST